MIHGEVTEIIRVLELYNANTTKKCPVISVCEAFFTLLKQGVTFHNNIDFVKDSDDIKFSYSNILDVQQINSSLLLHTAAIDDHIRFFMKALILCYQGVMTNDHPFHINEKLASNINMCLRSRDVILEYNSEIDIDAGISWDTNHSLILKSKQNIVFSPGRIISNHGTGSVILMAGVENKEGAVIFNYGAEIESSHGGKVEIYSHLVGITPNKYSNAHYYHQHVNPESSIDTYMWINNLEELQYMTYPFVNYALSRDIDATATRSWNNGYGFSPIGRKADSLPMAFRGKFNGNGHTIFGLHINRCEEAYVGLFSILMGYDIDTYSEVYNLTLKNASICGDHYVGAIAGGATHAELSGIKIENTHINGRSIIGTLIGSGSSVSFHNISMLNCSTNAEQFNGTLVGALRHSYLDHLPCINDIMRCVASSENNCIARRSFYITDLLLTSDSIDNFRDALNSSSFSCFSAKDRGWILNKVMDTSSQHFEILMNSNAVRNLNSEELFDMFDCCTRLFNAWWYAFLCGDQYFNILFNSSLVDQFDNQQILSSLQFKPAFKNGNTILTYIASFSTSDVLESFLSSKAFNKLKDRSKLELYNEHTYDGVDMFDILLAAKDHHKLKIFLNCSTCFGTALEEFGKFLISKMNGQSNMGLFTHQPVLGILLNSDFLTNSGQSNKQQVLSSLIRPYGISAREDEALPINMNLIHDQEIFRDFVCSRVMLSLDHEFKMKLLGEYYLEFEARGGCSI